MTSELTAPAAARPGGWRRVALAAALGAAALVVALGRQRALEWGDSLVPALVSLQRWTPFYWDQERFGMLVPLLAWPVRDPFWNLLLQRALMALGGLSAVVLLARHVLPGRDWPLCGALAAAALLLLAPQAWLFEYLADQPYGLSLALALGGLALAEPRPWERAADGVLGGGQGELRRHPWRVAGGLLLVLLAHWVNAAVGVVLGVLALARAAEDLVAGEPTGAVAGRLQVDAALLAAGLAAGQASIRLYPWWSGQPLRLALGFLPLAEWPRAWWTMTARALEAQGGWAAALAAVTAVGLAALALPSSRPVRRQVLARAATLAAAAALYAAFSGALAWVAENAFHWRYLAPSALLIHLAVVALAAEPLAASARLAVPALRGALLALPLAALATQGQPSLERARGDLDAAAGRWTADVLAARCDLVAGDYWSVWPAVWHVALAQAERGEHRPVYGLAHRSNPTVPLWWDRPHGALRICRTHGEAAEREAARWLPSYGLWPVEVVERRETVDVLRVAGP